MLHPGAPEAASCAPGRDRIFWPSTTKDRKNNGNRKMGKTGDPQLQFKKLGGVADPSDGNFRFDAILCYAHESTTSTLTTAVLALTSKKTSLASPFPL